MDRLGQGVILWRKNIVVTKAKDMYTSAKKEKMKKRFLMSGRIPLAVESDICFAHETSFCSAVIVVSEWLLLVT
jgi:hypothetical protein